MRAEGAPEKNTRKRCFQGGNALEMRFFRACGGQKWVYTGQMRAVGARKIWTQNWPDLQTLRNPPLVKIRVPQYVNENGKF